MSEVYCFTLVTEDLDEEGGETRSDIYILSTNFEEASTTIHNLLGQWARVYHNKIEEQDWTEELAQECIQSIFDVRADDNLFVYILQKYPHFIDADLITDIFNDDLPQTFEFALSQWPLEYCLDTWVALAVEYQDEKHLSLLLEKGVCDDGRGLAQACEREDRILFDTLYPKSNPHAALTYTECANLHWIEERIALEQKQRLDDQIAPHCGTRAQRKM